jgi:predicted 3-demethylubiquinone-9 3-methyltransferase (glyoxalase superfamily)
MEKKMPTISRIAPCLWFDGRSEEAARFYTAIFPNSRINTISHYPGVGQEVHGQEPGSVLTVVFELDGQSFTALNGPPIFKFTEAVSLQVFCDTKEELDHYWDRLGAGGDEQARQCGWLKDKYGLSWQVVPRFLADYMTDPDPRKVERVFAALSPMKKLDFDELRRVFAG